MIEVNIKLVTGYNLKFELISQVEFKEISKLGSFSYDLNLSTKFKNQIFTNQSNNIIVINNGYGRYGDLFSSTEDYFLFKTKCIFVVNTEEGKLPYYWGIMNNIEETSKLLKDNHFEVVNKFVNPTKKFYFLNNIGYYLVVNYTINNKLIDSVYYLDLEAINFIDPFNYI